MRIIYKKYESIYLLQMNFDFKIYKSKHKIIVWFIDKKMAQVKFIVCVKWDSI